MHGTAAKNKKVNLRLEAGGDLDIHSPVVTTCTTRFNNKWLFVLQTPFVHVFLVIRRTYGDIFPLSNSTFFLTEAHSVFHEVQNTNCSLLGYYVASSGNFFPTFRYNSSVRDYHYSLRNARFSCTSRGSLKSRNVQNTYTQTVEDSFQIF